MVKVAGVVVVAIAMLLVAAADAPPALGQTAADQPFRAWFEQQVAAPTALPPDVREVAHRYRYVLIAGFLNEGFQIGYYNENRKALLDAGVRKDAIHVVFPPRGKSGASP